MRFILCLAAFSIAAAGCDMMGDAPKPLAKHATFELYLVSPVETPTTKRARDPSAHKEIFLIDPPIVTTADVKTVQLDTSDTLSPKLFVVLTPAGGTKLSRATAKPKGGAIACVINGTVVSIPTVHSQLGASFAIEGGRGGPTQWFETLAEK